MAKGKYAAKALNRAASVDNEVIVDLRRQIAEMATQRDAALEAASTLRSNFHSEVLAAVDETITRERQSLSDEREALLAAVDELHADAAREITEILSDTVRSIRLTHGDDAAFPPCLLTGVESRSPSITRLYGILGVKSEAGALLERILDAGEVFKDKGQRRARSRRSISRLEADLRQNKHLHGRARQDMVRALASKSTDDE